jgi:hypothetical protein
MSRSQVTVLVPGYAAKHAKDKKYQADRASTQPIVAIDGGPHILVPFAMKDGGRLGAHALALLMAVLAIFQVPEGRFLLIHISYE